MTWHAPRGLTVLSGLEARMFAEAIQEICHEFLSAPADEVSQFEIGPSSINRMTKTQQAASLELVTNALFKESLEPFPLVAWSEAMLAAILGFIQDRVHVEIDANESTELRNQIILLTDGEVTPEEKDWDSHDEWEFVFDCYETQFLWDHDFEVDGSLDVAPENARMFGSLLGVDDDYHSTIPPDLKSDSELDACVKRIANVIGIFL